MRFIFKYKYKIGICIIIVALLTGATVFALRNNKFSDVGKKIDEINKVSDTSIVASVGDKKKTKKDFDTFKALYTPADKVPSDTELIDKIIEKEVIYQQALKENITVSDEEVNKALQEQKDAVYKNSQMNEDFKNLIQGKNISEEEYWGDVADSLKKGLIRGKYINELKDEFRKENPNIENSQFQSKFNEYYNNKVNSLKNATKIEKFVK
jgi:hypothetical protein